MIRPASRSRSLRDPRTGLATAVWSGLVIAAGVLAARRLDGSFSGLTLLSACALAGTAALVSLTALWVRPSRACGGNRGVPLGPLAVSLAAPVGLGAVLLAEPSGAAGLCLILGLALLIVLTVLLEGSGPRTGQSLSGNGDRHPSSCGYMKSEPQRTGASPLFGTDSWIGDPQQGGATHGVWTSVHANTPPFRPASVAPFSDGERGLPGADDSEGISQWMTRSQVPDGGERVEGGVKVAFLPGQKQTAVHISFCPPLAGPPTVECEVLDDVPVRLRVTAAQPYGLRIEARRIGDTASAATLDIGFVAATAAVRIRAA